MTHCRKLFAENGLQLFAKINAETKRRVGRDASPFINNTESDQGHRIRFTRAPNILFDVFRCGVLILPIGKDDLERLQNEHWPS
jgi:hypothetical protein